MITLSGQLSVRSVMGRNGAFNVAKLATSIGEFSIKDAVLDQYDEGKYQGDFVITQIKPSYYTTRSGSLIVEIRAWLDGMTLERMERLSKDEAAAVTPSVQDPAEEDAPKATPASAGVPLQASLNATLDDTPFGMTAEELKRQGIAPAKSATNAQAAARSAGKAPAEDSEAPSSDDAALFGLLWPLGETVKLDATVERLIQRKQIERLKVLGFALDIKTQLWSKTATS